MAKATYRGTVWTQEEDDLLRRIYPIEGPEGVLKRTEGRSLTAIRSRAKYLCVKLSREALAARRTEHLNALREAGMLCPSHKDEAAPIPAEYIQAADIFQVGYRIARDMGVVHEYA